MGVLQGVRVLDLADVKGALCGKLLGDMGAEVLKVEPPGGDPMRRIGPFYRGEPHPDRSLFFWFYHTSKRGLTLNLRKPPGPELFRRLVARADIVIETFPPGTLAELGLGYEELRQINPRVILTSITPFGQSGPYRDYKTSNLVAEALGGMAYVNGFPEEPPLQSLGLQAYHSASFFAAIGTLAALWAREEIGEGQWVDVSIQEATAASVEQVSAFFHQGLGVEKRRGGLHWSRFFRVGRCRDGYILHCTLGDWTSLVEWVKADGKAQDLDRPEWEDVWYRRDHAEHLFDVLDGWAKDHTVAELMEGAQLRRIPYAMVRPPQALAEDPQLRERGFFVPVEHPELGKTFRYPGAPFLFQKTPWRISRRPPLLGEHNGEVYCGELGLREEELAVLAADEVI